MKHQSDQKLGALAKQVSNCAFSYPLDLSPQALQVARSKFTEGKLRNVRAIPGGINGHSVQMYIGGKIRCLGYYSTDWLSACRLADLYTFRFGPLRLKFPRANEPGDYNFSEAQAKLDWSREPIANLVLEVEDYLKSIGALNPQSKKPINEQIISLQKGNDSQEKRIEALEAQVKMLVEYITAEKNTLKSNQPLLPSA